MEINPITPNTREDTREGKWWLHRATAAVQPDSTRAHNNSEPS